MAIVEIVNEDAIYLGWSANNAYDQELTDLYNAWPEKNLSAEKLNRLREIAGVTNGPIPRLKGVAMRSDPFDISLDPVRMTQMAAGALMFIRGDLEPAKKTIERSYSRAGHGQPIPARFAGLSTLGAAVARLAHPLAERGTNRRRHGQHLQCAFKSDTGQLVWQRSREQPGRSRHHPGHARPTLRDVDIRTRHLAAKQHESERQQFLDGCAGHAGRRMVRHSPVTFTHVLPAVRPVISAREIAREPRSRRRRLDCS
jgi:hypothetical protein